MKKFTQKRITSATKVVLVFLLTVSVLSASFVFPNETKVEAAFNKQINYQGKLTNASNVAVADGVYHMKFWLLTSPTAPTTTAVWAEDRSTVLGNRVTISNGLFSVMLGSSTPLTTVDFNQTLYLGIEIGGSAGSPTWDGEMSPRKVLGAVPAAFIADTIDGVSSEQFFRNDITNSTSSATTSLSVAQNGAGKIAEFFGNAGMSAFSVLSNGNVGVGTTTPTSRLSVSDTVLAGSGSLIGSVLDLVQTWNTTGLPTAVKLNVTDTASHASSLLMDLQVGGVSKFKVAKNGDVTLAPSAVLSVPSGGFIFNGADGYVYLDSSLTRGGSPNGFAVGTSMQYTFTNGGVAYATVDTALQRNAAGVVEINNGTLGQYRDLQVRAINPSSGNLGLGTTTPGTLFSLGNTGTNTINISTTATSTFGYGINLRNGCFAVNGVCVGAGITSSQWTTAGSDIYYSTGNVGIGTTSPYAAFSVAGRGVFNQDVRADYFTATSTSVASVLPYASTTAFSVSGMTYLSNFRATASSTIGGGTQATGLTVSGGATTTGNAYFAGNIGIGTSGPQNKLDIMGSSDTFALNLGGQIGQNTSIGISFGYSAPGFGTSFRKGGIAFKRTDADWGRGDIQILNNSAASSNAVGFSDVIATFQSGGNFGVGTTSPGTLLSLGNTGANTINISPTATSTFGYGIDLRNGCFAVNGTCLTSSSGTVGSGTAGQFPYYAGSGTTLTATSSLFVTTAGNVGVGVTTVGKKFEVFGDIVSRASTGTGVASSFIADSNGLNLWLNSSYNPASPSSGWARILTATSTGYVGIGTTSPAGRLHVSGATGDSLLVLESDIDNDDEDDNSGISFLQDGSLTTAYTGFVGAALTTARGDVITGALNNAFVLGTVGGTSNFNALQFMTGNGAGIGVVQMTINTDGNVGIGTTSPYAKLSVAGQVVAQNYVATSTTATSTFAYDVSTAGRLSVLQTGTNATIIGNTTGNARGSGAIDIQSSRSLATQVASGASSIALGINNTASVSTAIAIGHTNSVSGIGASGIGYSNLASANDASAFGAGNTANASAASAFGFASNATAANAVAVGYITTASASGASAFGSGITNNISNSTQIGPSDAAKLTILSTGNVGIGTTSPYAKLSVHGQGVFTQDVRANYFTATSTTATSTFAWGISTNLLNVTSSTASSTFANGINLSAGCFAINGTCVGGSGTVGSGTAGQFPYYAGSGTTLTATSSLFLSTAGYVGVGTIIPSVALDVVGDIKSTGVIQSTSGIFRGDDQYHQIILHNGGNNSDYIEWGDTLANGGGHRFFTGGASPSLRFQVADDGSYFSGNVGIGTTSPYSMLSVAGQVVARNFVATTSNATSTLAGGLTVATGGGNVGIGTSTPSAKLEVFGGARFAESDGSMIYAGSYPGIGLYVHSEKTTPFLVTGASQAGLLLAGGDGGAGDAFISFGDVDESFDGTRFEFIQANKSISLIGGAPQINLTDSVEGLTYQVTNVGAYLSHSYNSLGFLSTDGSSTSLGAATGGEIGLYANGGSAINVFRANGRVGFGTSTPGTSLGIGNTGASTINLDATATSTFGYGINLRNGCFAVNGTCLTSSSGTVGSGTTGQFPYYAGSGTTLTATSSLFVATSGNIGIGSVSPTYPLTVDTTAPASANIVLNLRNSAGTGDTYLRLQNANASGEAYVYQRGTTGLAGFTGSNGFSVDIYGGSNSVGVFKNNGDVALGGTITSASTFAGARMAISGSTGNVGVGTTSPFSRLSVQTTSSAGTTSLFAVASSTNGTLFNVLGNGRVGIGGTTSPSYVFAVAPTTNTDGVQTAFFRDQTPTTGRTAVVIQAGAGNLASNRLLSFLNNSGTEMTFVRSDGLFGATFMGTSDDVSAFMVDSTVDTAAYLAGLNLGSTAIVGWGSNQWWSNKDVLLSRLSAGKLGVGTATQGSSDGTLIAGTIGIGTTTPGTLLSLGNTGSNTTNISVTSTSTFATGIDLRGGCFSVNGTCVGGGSGSGTVGSGTAGQFPYYAGSGTTLTATSSLFLATSGNVGIGTTSPYAALSVAGRGVFNEDVRANYFTATSTSIPSSFKQANFDGAVNFQNVSASFYGSVVASQFDTDGYLGINTASNGGPLSVLSTGLDGCGVTPSLDVLSDSMEFKGCDISFGDIDGISTGAVFTIEGTGPSFNFINGYVGIGTPDPGSPLHVYGVQDPGFGAVSSARVEHPSNGASAYLGYDDAASCSAICGYASFYSEGISGHDFYGAGSSYIATLSVSGISGTTANFSSVSATTITGTTIRAGNGSVTAPTLTFSSDTNTGLYLPAADTIGFSTGGVERLRIGSTGNIGVATTSPWAKFSIGTVDLSQASPSFVIASSSTGVATTTQFIVQNGRVGIGTAAPTNAFHVIGNGAASTYQATYENTTSGGVAGFALKNSGWEIRFRTNPNNGWFEITDNSNNIYHRWNEKSYLLASDGSLGFISETNFSTATTGARDTTVSRLGAGKIGVGTAAQGTSNGTLIAGAIGIGTTSPYAMLSVAGEVVANNFTATSTTATSTLAGGLKVGTSFFVLQNGNLGVGTSSPLSKFDVVNTSSSQIRLSNGTTNYSDFTTDSVGDLTVNPTGGDFRLNDQNIWACSGGSCASGSPAGTGNIIAETSIGVGSSTPFAAVSVGADAAIATTEKGVSTTANMTVNWLQGNQQRVTLNQAGHTISFTNYVAGQTLRLVVCQDGAGSRTTTWDAAVMWPANTAPTLTTTGNKCDIVTFLATTATSTLKIFGSSVLNF